MNEKNVYMNEDLSTRCTAEIGEQFGVGYGAIHAEGMASDEYAEATKKQIEKYMRPVVAGAASCCIDGRPCEHRMDGSLPGLGPKLAGGALVTAYAAAELTGWFKGTTGSSADRMAAMQTFLVARGIQSGVHCDQSAYNQAFDAGTTGCGANDRLPEILARLHSDKATVDALTEVLLGGTYSVDATNYTDAGSLAERQSDWRPVVMIDEVKNTQGERNIEVLVSDHSRTHGHNELAVIFNEVEGTTFDRDAFAAETGKQAFCVDMWYLRSLANTVAEGSETPDQENSILHAMVAYQVATYLTLCDGSQRPILVNAQ